MSAKAQLISVDEYLHTSFHPDCEYIDGEVIERNLGEKPHSKAQRKLIAWFSNREESLGTFCFPEQRVQVRQTRFRVPDVCVYIGHEPDENIFRTPPFLAIEILSPEDRASSLQGKIEDYRAFGIPWIWVIDPMRRAALIHTADTSQEVRDAILRTRNPEIEIPLNSLFD